MAIDPSVLQNASYGLGDYTKQDIGGGKYNILGADNAVLGVGYKSPGEAAYEIMKANAEKALSQGDRWLPTNEGGYVNPYALHVEGADNTPEIKEGFRLNPETGYMEKMYSGYAYNDKPYQTLEEAQRAIEQNFQQNPNYFGGGFADWELLGQALGGSTNLPNVNEWGNLPLNSKSENIASDQTLYGSEPVFKDGKLIGYQTDFSPGEDAVKTWSDGQGVASTGPIGYQAKYGGKGHAWQTGLARKFGDQAAYDELAYTDPETGKSFVPLENAAKIPGWTNVEGFSEQDLQNGGLLHEVFKFVDPILDTVDPMHNKVQKATTGSGETEKQSAYFQTIFPMVIDAIWPGIGTLIGGVDSASRGDAKGVASNIAGYGLGSLLQGSDLTGLGNADAVGKASNAATSGAIKGGVQGGIQTGTLSGAATGALTGAIASGINSGVGSATADAGALERAAAQLGSKAAVGGLNAAIRGGDVGQGALTGLSSAAVNTISTQVGNYLKTEFPEYATDPKMLSLMTQLVIRESQKGKK